MASKKNQGLDHRQGGDHIRLRETLLEQFQPLQERLCLALEESQELLNQFQRSTSLAVIFNAPMISANLMEGIDAIFGSQSPKVTQLEHGTIQKTITWLDVMTVAQSKIEYKEAGVYHYYLDDFKATAELSDFQHNMILSGLPQKLIQPWYYKRDVQTELYTLSLMAEMVATSNQLASKVIEVNNKIIGKANQRTRALQGILNKWKELTHSNTCPSSLVLEEAQHDQDIGYAAVPNKETLVGTACSSLKELKRAHPMWRRRKFQSILPGKITRLSFHHRKTMPAPRIMAQKLFGRTHVRMGQKKRLYSRNDRRVTVPDAPLWMPMKASEQSQSLIDQPGPLMEHPYPQTENFNHACLHGNFSEDSGNRRKLLEEASSEGVKTSFDRQNSPPELGPNIVNLSNDSEKLAEHESLTRRPAHLNPEAEALEGQSNPGIEISERRGSAGPFDGNNERVAALTEPKKNASLTFHGNTVPGDRQPQTISRNSPKEFPRPYPSETANHSEEAVCQGPGGSNLPDGVLSSATHQLNVSATSTHRERKGTPIHKSNLEVQIINRPQPTRSRNRRWATQDLERLPFWFMQRRHLNKEEIQAEFLAEFQHERSFGAIHTAFKRQMRIYQQNNHANRMPHFVRDIDQPGRYFVAADNFMHPASQLGDGQLQDYRSLPPEAPTPEILTAIPGYPDGIEDFPERAYLSESPSTIAYRATTTENTPFSPSFYDQGK